MLPIQGGIVKRTLEHQHLMAFVVLRNHLTIKPVPLVANLPSCCRNTYSHFMQKIYPDDLTRIYYVAQALLNIQQD
jgi:hypothetical protein